MAASPFPMNIPPMPELTRQVADPYSYVLWQNLNVPGPIHEQARQFFLDKKLPACVKEELLPDEFLTIIRARLAFRRLFSMV
jgi:hypothetical protein